jgi:hypothetical protein
VTASRRQFGDVRRGDLSVHEQFSETQARPGTLGDTPTTEAGADVNPIETPDFANQRTPTIGDGEIACLLGLRGCAIGRVEDGGE